MERWRPKCVKFLLIYSPPLVSAGDWFQEPPGIPKSMDAEVPYIKWHSIVSPPYLRLLHPWVQPTVDQASLIFLLNELFLLSHHFFFMLIGELSEDKTLYILCRVLLAFIKCRFN